MKKNSIGYFFVFFIIVFWGFVFASGCTDTQNKNLIQFVVASDIHIVDWATTQEDTRLQDLFSYAKKLCKNKTRKYIDGVFFVGDISNDGYSQSLQKFFDIVSESKDKKTTTRAVLGNHEFYYQLETTVERFLTASNYETADTHFVLNGFHFIMLNPIIDGNDFTQQQVQWLDNQLQLATSQDKTKPVFVFQHQPVQNTVYGSENWGINTLKSVLEKYPQVIDFSGHSHFPISDPRSIWQDKFTAVGTATLSYFEMGLNNVSDALVFPTDFEGNFANTYHQASSGGQFWLVEVTKNFDVRLSAYDIDAKVKVAGYNIGKVGDTSNFRFTNQRKENSDCPVFSPSAQIDVNINNDQATITIPSAYCKDNVESYCFKIFDQQNKLVSTAYKLSCTFHIPNPTSFYHKFENLKPGIYKASVYAINSWNKASEPLCTQFKIN